MGKGYQGAPWVFKGSALDQLNLVRCVCENTAATRAGTLAPLEHDPNVHFACYEIRDCVVCDFIGRFASERSLKLVGVRQAH